MALSDNKILTSERNAAYVKSNQGRRLNGTVEQNKDAFDKFPQLIMDKYNALVDLLTTLGLDSIATDISSRYTKNETDTKISEETNDLIETIEFTKSDGKFKITTKSGTVSTIDTDLEKIPASFTLITGSDGKTYLRITNQDGSYTETDVTSLLNVYTFSDSDTLDFTESPKYAVTAEVKQNSITLDHLSLAVVSTLEGYVSSAAGSATSAAGSATEAETSATNAGTFEQSAKDYAKAAETSKNTAAGSATSAGSAATTASQKASAAENYSILSQSYAKGGTGTRTGEDTDNAKYYCEQASASETNAKGYEESAAEHSETAQSASASAETARNQAKGYRDEAASASSSASSSATSASDSASAALASKNAAASSASSAASANTAAQSAKEAAEAAQAAAETARDEAQDIAGGDYATKTELNAKISKVTSPTAGNIPTLTTDGQIQDSGKKVSDFENAVKYTNQTLTNAQKTQARANIGAGTSDFSGSYDDLTDTPTIPEGAFISVYGTTTFEELQEAVNAKKQVFCYYTPVPIITYVFRLSTLNTQYGAIFEACDTDSFFDIIFCSIDSEWNHTGGYLMSPPSSLGGIMMVTQGDYGKEWELVDPPFASEPTILTSTLSAGSTTLTLSNTAITTSSTIDIYTDKWGVNPTDVAVEAGKITLTFDKQSTALGVKVEVR